MRQPVGVGGAFVSALAATFIVSPLFAVSEQHQQKYSEHIGSLSGVPIVNDRPRARQPRVEGDVESIGRKGSNEWKGVPSNSRRANNAIATTEALAGVNPAVRAPRPVRGSSRHAGISSPHSARSLQDWQVEDFVLLATVDGSIHARDRSSGAPRWELEVENPMVETTYYPQNHSQSENPKVEYDFLWIVEPSRDGDIYVYNPLVNELQKLHLTVKQLAEDMSPYESADPAVVYNAEKKTKLYTIEAATGRITKVFGTGGTFGKSHQSCPKTTGLQASDEEACKPSASFVLGRTEYTITIQNRDTTEPICTLVYSEWGPNNRDEDLLSQYFTTMDNKYVYSLHDGRIFGVDYSKMADGQRTYSHKLSSPVARVFDVVRPLGMDERDPQLIVLQEPIGPVYNELNPNALIDRNRIFVNHTEAGGWFAMSENTYPLVTGKAQLARCYDQYWLESKVFGDGDGMTHLREAFVGVHDISEYEPWQGSGLTLSAPSPEPQVVDEAPVPVDAEPSASPSLSVIGKSRIIGRAADNVIDIIISVIFVLLVAFLSINRGTVIRFVKQTLDITKHFPSVDQARSSLPSTPVISEGPWSKEPLTPPLDQDNVVQGEISGAVPPILHSPTPSGPLGTPPRSRSGSLGEDRGRTEDGHGVRFAEPSPTPENGELAGLAQPKKKARRGVRGGTKHKKKRSSSKHEQGDATEEPLLDSIRIAPEPAIDTAVQRFGGSSVMDTSGTGGTIIQIGHLQLDTLQVLGRGSHGTMVYKGSFGGREVAVKRMLLDFYDIASHEVSLLQESDGHPNVVRYYDRESAGDFLYIALELCPASLEEVIRGPENYPTLVGPGGLDLPDVLKQITMGVQYLHSLKIVHRDIKPQNILVSAMKMVLSNPSAVQPPRLLISDFGLCKKLEGDQNSFRATTAHAAGTSGWRAPELLVDEDLATPQSAAAVNQKFNQTSGSTSEPAVVDPQTNRRATRAIDIFSLGCVFYYVLTNGNHPYDKDGIYMREANIVKGFYNLDDLQSLGDYQWEAKDLIKKMLAHDPCDRPDATTILHHPFFWSAEDRLDFLCHVSDGFEFEPRDPPSSALVQLESYGPDIIQNEGSDFLRLLPREFRDTLGKQRKYNGDKVLDLLRALRNKKNHYEDIPESIKEKLGGFPSGYLSFWTTRFPNLLMACHRVVMEVGWEGRDRFRKYYGTM